MAKDDKNNGLGRVDPLSALIYLMTFGYAGKAPVFGGPTVTELPPQEFRPEDHYQSSIGSASTIGSNPDVHLRKTGSGGSRYRG